MAPATDALGSTTKGKPLASTSVPTTEMSVFSVLASAVPSSTTRIGSLHAHLIGLASSFAMKAQWRPPLSPCGAPGVFST